LLITRSDGERSTVALREALAGYHGGRAVPEVPAKGESQSNSVREEAGETVREFTRVMKEQLEDKAEIVLESCDVITLWMIRWAAMIISRCLAGKDGRTVYERRKGRKCRIPALVFGEKVWRKEIRDHKEKKDKFNSEWKESTCLGRSRNSNETIIGTREGTVRAYAIRRQDEEQRRSGNMLKEIKGAPKQPNLNKPGLQIPVRITFDPPEAIDPIPSQPARQERQIRRTKLTGVLLGKYGYTEGCDGCRYKKAGLQEVRPHAEECRRGIVAAMDRDAEGQEKNGEES
jgi:hypothetical protein